MSLPQQVLILALHPHGGLCGPNTSTAAEMSKASVIGGHAADGWIANAWAREGSALEFKARFGFIRHATPRRSRRLPRAHQSDWAAWRSKVTWARTSRLAGAPPPGVLPPTRHVLARVFGQIPPTPPLALLGGTSGSLNRIEDRKQWHFKEPVKSGVVSHSRGKTCGKFTLGLPKRLPNRR